MNHPHPVVQITDSIIEIGRVLGDDVAVPGPHYSPTLHSLITPEGNVTARLLASSRPGTLSRTVSHVWGESAADVHRLMAAAVSGWDAAGFVSVKWEDDTAAHGETATRLGFTQLPSPAVSGPGTLAPATAWVRYASPWEHDVAPYYRQTTDFSCGPVSLLMAQAHWQGAESMTRERERQIWRRATRFTGCGVRSLSLQVDRSRFDVSVFDTEYLQPQVTPMEPRDARAFANEEDNLLAASAGIAIAEREYSMSEVAAEVDRGSRVLVLIDELRFHGEPMPHWVVVHAHRDGVVLLNDPWVDATEGESWVSAVDVPVALAELDAMAWWGEPRYRSVLVLRDGHPAVRS